MVGCIGVLATLTAKVISWWSVTQNVFPDFLTPVLTQLSFQSHRLLFSHDLAEVKGENTPERKFGTRVSNSQQPGHESDILYLRLKETSMVLSGEHGPKCPRRSRCRLIDCMVFNALFNSTSDISLQPVHLSML